LRATQRDCSVACCFIAAYYLCFLSERMTGSYGMQCSGLVDGG
jgi:hypothetical protein